MCIVTYLPTGAHTFILTSNTDEHITRKQANFPAYIHTSLHPEIIFPQDGNTGGTWIACSANQTVCLLNGAFQPHISQPPYRTSRGLVLLAAFEFKDTTAFIKYYPLENIEPFTMLLIPHIGTPLITELRWDGQKKYINLKDASQPQIWSSVSLYPASVMQLRKSWFEQWLLENPVYSFENIRQFHKFRNGQDDTSNRSIHDAVATVSITTVVCEEDAVTMHYDDVKTHVLRSHKLSRIKATPSQIV